MEESATLLIALAAFAFALDVLILRSALAALLRPAGVLLAAALASALPLLLAAALALLASALAALLAALLRIAADLSAAALPLALALLILALLIATRVPWVVPLIHRVTALLPIAVLILLHGLVLNMEIPPVRRTRRALQGVCPHAAVGPADESRLASPRRAARGLDAVAIAISPCGDCKTCR